MGKRRGGVGEGGELGIWIIGGNGLKGKCGEVFWLWWIDWGMLRE